MKEIFKPIQGYEGFYEISNFGNVKSLSREQSQVERIMKPGVSTCGYFGLVLCVKGKEISYRVHQLVWDHFGNGKRNGHIMQVDHIDNDRLNNRIDNLQLLSNRENTTKGLIQNNKITSSKYIGVHWSNKYEKWVARIYFNKRYKFLGHFQDEKQASKAYKKALKILKEIT